jgi:hypothetical protein
MNHHQRGRNALLAGLCAIGFSGTAGAAPVISEVFYDADGGDAGVTFVELFGAPGESLDGMSLQAVNGSGGSVYLEVSLGGMLPADGIFVIGDDNGGMTAVPGADMIADVDLQNGPDSLLLRDAVSLLDAVGYGAFGAGDVFAGEGAPAPDPIAGNSIARFNPLVDSDDNSADFIALAIPTPGQVPGVSAVPLPAAGWLFASGLTALAAMRRRSPARVAPAPA